MRCDPAPLDIDAALRADGLPGPALAGRAAYRCVLDAAVLGATVLGATVSVASALGVSALGSTAAGRSIYFGASAAGGASTILDPSGALAGAAADVVSTPPSERLRSPACAAADTKTNPAIRMNLRILKSPLEVDRETMDRRANIYVRQVTPPWPSARHAAYLVKEAAQRAASSGQVHRFLLLARIHPAVLEFCEGPGPALEEVACRIILPSAIAIVGTAFVVRPRYVVRLTKARIRLGCIGVAPGGALSSPVGRCGGRGDNASRGKRCRACGAGAIPVSVQRRAGSVDARHPQRSRGSAGGLHAPARCRPIKRRRVVLTRRRRAAPYRQRSKLLL